MSRTLAVVLACALIFAAVVAEEAPAEEPSAEEPIQGNENGFSLLIARRTFLNDTFVENMEMTVRIEIWNLGTKEAMNVVIEENYPSDQFSAVEKKTFEKILATENVTYEYKVTPNFHGVTNIASTHLKYDDREAYIDDLQNVLVISTEEYVRRHNLHILDWCVYGVSALVSASVPALVYFKKDRSFFK